MRSSSLVLACLALALVLIPSQPPLRAGEPDGFIRIRPLWFDGRDDLMVRIDPVVPLAGARLILSVPDAVTVTPKEPFATGLRPVHSVPGMRQLALDMGSAASGLTLDLELVVPPGGGGIATFIVEGRTADGRAFSEGIGVALGRSERGDLARDGAIEYPAATAGGGR